MTLMRMEALAISFAFACAGCKKDGEQKAQKKDRGKEQIGLDCKGPKGRKCLALGVRFEKGKGVKKDPKKALELYRKTCEAGDQDGCVLAAHMYRDGAGIPKDLEQALELYERACAQKQPNACMSLGTMYGLGKGVPRDPKKSAAMLDKACKAGIKDACKLAETVQGAVDRLKRTEAGPNLNHSGEWRWR